MSCGGSEVLCSGPCMPAKCGLGLFAGTLGQADGPECVQVYLPEVLPDDIRGKGAALCTCLNWVSNLAIGLSFPIMLRALHIDGAYMVFALINAAAVVFVFRLVIETKQRSLAEITQLLVHDD